MNGRTDGLVSTIVPVYQRPALLREAVASVLAQTWRPIEVVIVDDGSRDETPAVAAQLAAQAAAIVRVVRQENAGPGAARQAGLAHAKGEFVQFLDSDDLLLPTKFELQVAALRAQPAAGIAYGPTRTREPDGNLRHEPAQRSGEAHERLFPAVLQGRLWETSTPLYRRSALDTIGPWPSRRQMEDWEFDAQAGAAGIRLVHSRDWVAEYRLHGGARLAHAWMSDAVAMRDRLRAHLAIHRHALRAGVPAGAPELQTFGRTLFAVAREAARRGFEAEASELLRAAREINAGAPRPAADLRLYAAAVRLLGWRAVRWLGT